VGYKVSLVLLVQFLFSLEDFNHGVIIFIDTKAKCRHLKKLTCKGTSLSESPSPPRMGWSSNFIGSESGQIHSVKLFQNMVSSRTQSPHPLPATHCLYILYFYTGKGGRELNQREGERGNSSQSWVENIIPT
jgi:hypothetical protein